MLSQDEIQQFWGKRLFYAKESKNKKVVDKTNNNENN